MSDTTEISKGPGIALIVVGCGLLVLGFILFATILVRIDFMTQNIIFWAISGPGILLIVLGLKKLGVIKSK